MRDIDRDIFTRSEKAFALYFLWNEGCLRVGHVEQQ
jgi:hypothetical protein